MSRLEKAKQEIINYAAAEKDKNPEDLKADIIIKTLDVSEI